ncbi:peptide chain release factor N(5)-glutamine methyltransferase [Candidatus Margulisiibacteriota bacterium]
MSNKWTIKRLLDWTTEHFTKHQIENPHLEAEILLAHALNTERIKLYVNFEQEVNEKDRGTFRDYVTRRTKKEPTAYITGYQPFMSLKFKVTRDVLIPRPETELLLQEAVNIAKSYDKKLSVLDIGTGSGAIAVSLARFTDNIEVCATDLSKKALEIAAENAKIHKVEGKVKFIETDIFPKENIKFDIIISNPPYIKSGDIKDLQTEVKDYEPVQALDGGKDGLDYYRKILDKAGNYINKEGYLLLEIGSEQSKQIVDLINNGLKPNNIEVKKDLSGIERMVIVRV